MPNQETKSKTDTTEQPSDEGVDETTCCAFLPLPEPSYPCLNQFCADEVSYPPDMLFWVDDGETRGWMCDNCWDQHDWNDDEVPQKGISLEKEIIRQHNVQAI